MNDNIALWDSLSNPADYDASNPLWNDPADIMSAGGLSPYAIMGLGENVIEWKETSFNLNKSLCSSARGIRGGDWNDFSLNLSSSARFNNPAIELYFVSFRAASLSSSASVPEPGTFGV